MNVGLLAIDRPSAEPLRPSASLGSFSPTWTTRSPGRVLSPRVLHYHHRPVDRSRSSYFRAIQPSPPVLRQATLLRDISRGEFSMEFSSTVALFARLPFWTTTARTPRCTSLAADPKYGQVPFRFLMANYVIAARWDRKRDVSKNWKPPDDRAEVNIVISLNYILLYFWPWIFLTNFIRENIPKSNKRFIDLTVEIIFLCDLFIVS